MIHNNRLQVINQYEVDADGATRAGRYDVTILVNGLPLVHVELKRRGVAIREAFNQINRYQRDSFWSGSGLFEYVQLFVISKWTAQQLLKPVEQPAAPGKPGAVTRVQHRGAAVTIKLPKLRPTLWIA